MNTDNKSPLSAPPLDEAAPGGDVPAPVSAPGWALHGDKGGRLPVVDNFGIDRPVRNCGHVNPGDGLCMHPGNITPECHADACPIAKVSAPAAVLAAVREYIAADDEHRRACGNAGEKWRALLDRLRAAGTEAADIEANADPADLAEFKAGGKNIFAAADPATARYKAAKAQLRAVAEGVAR